MMNSKQISYYAVRVGKRVGVYDNWKDTQAQIEGVSRPVFKKFSTYQEAFLFISNSNETANVSNVAVPNKFVNYRSTMYERDKSTISNWLPKALPPIYEKNEESIWIFTDGACKGNKNVAINSIPAGWGMVVLKCSGLNELGVNTTVLHESCGAVVTSPTSPNYLGAEHGKNLVR